MTTLIIICIPPSSGPDVFSVSHCAPLSFLTSLSPSVFSLFLPPAAPLSLGHLFQGAPPLNLGNSRPHVPLGGPRVRVSVCVSVHTAAQEEGGSLCSAQLKGRGITAAQTLIKAFQPPMAPLIQS